MAKRIRYKIGDIFLIPLENDLKGVGRVLKNYRSTIFIELYRIKPIQKAEEFSFENILNEKPLVMHWCYDCALKKGEWEIIDNKPIEGEIEMPYFWTQDAGDMKYYIQKGTTESHDTYGEYIEISKDETYKYEPYGIGNEISERNRYIRKLREVALI